MPTDAAPTSTDASTPTDTSTPTSTSGGDASIPTDAIPTDAPPNLGARAMQGMPMTSVDSAPASVPTALIAPSRMVTVPAFLASVPTAVTAPPSGFTMPAEYVDPYGGKVFGTSVTSQSPPQPTQLAWKTINAARIGIPVQAEEPVDNNVSNLTARDVLAYLIARSLEEHD
ncbi:hypothetical protein BC835DRAFT_1337125 [Cytidiella melzeri]|nr:hypothetical protein BC835DRAFT_1337125 [Cytidiella melzeri]